MQIFFLLTFIFCWIYYSLAAASIQFYKDPAHPGKCVLRDLVLAPGEIYNNPNECEQITCYERSQASIFSCGVYQPPKGCVAKKIQPKAPYPQCCILETICNNVLTGKDAIAPIIL